MSYDYTCVFTTEPKPGIKVITLTRPESLNAISLRLADEFLHTLDELKYDRNCRVVILTGAGRGFCAGTDLKEMDEFSKQPDRLNNQWWLQKTMAAIISTMRSIPQPIICAQNGAAAGGGASFVMASDIRIAVPKAKTILAYINVGMSGADMGSSYFLPRLIGLSRASEIMYTGRPVLADEAERIGLISRIVEPEDLMNVAMEYADTLLSKAELGLICTKESLNVCLQNDLDNQCNFENRNQFVCTAVGSFAEGAASFANK